MNRFTADQVTDKWKEFKGARSEWHVRPVPSEDYFNGYDEIKWNSEPPTIDRNLMSREDDQ